MTGTNPEQWNRHKDLLETTLELSDDARLEFLERVRAEDPTVHKELVALLAKQEAARTFLKPDPPTFGMSEIVADRYRVVRLLGRGGMGEVYEVVDSQIDEPVALKTVRHDAALDRTAVSRLIHELQLARRVTHPNVCRVFDVGRHSQPSGEVLFFTMELLRGQTLATRLKKRGPIPPEEVLSIAREVAEGITAAHAQGIVHRDLKPGNIIVEDSGRVVITDFGLARQDGRGDATSFTKSGRLIGTIAYMAPEQLVGGKATKASDIYSFALVLHEIVTGRRPSDDHETGPTKSLPPGWSEVMDAALHPDPQHRPTTAHELVMNLAEGSTATKVAGELKTSSAPRARIRRLRVGAAVVVSLVLLLLIGVAVFEQIATVKDPGFQLASVTPLTNDRGLERSPSLSPDGTLVVYEKNGEIFLKLMGGDNAINLTNDPELIDSSPVVSPDRAYIAFRSERGGGGIFIMGLTGESLRRLTSFGFDPSWSPAGDEVLFATQAGNDPANLGVKPSQAWTVNLTTGAMRQLVSLNMLQPVWSPGHKRIAYWAGRHVEGEGVDRDVWTVASDGTGPVAVTDDAATDWGPVWSPDGNYLYFASDRGGSMNLWRVRMDEDTGVPLGPPEAITTGGTASRHSLSIARDGNRMAYVEELQTANISQVAFDPVDGKIVGTPVPVTRGNQLAAMPAPSPDGGLVAFWIGTVQEDIALVRSDGNGSRLLTDDSYRDRFPRWSPDGAVIAFYSNRSGNYEVWTIRPDGSDLSQLTNTGVRAAQMAWSPDGSTMVYAGQDLQIMLMDPRKPWSEQTPEQVAPGRLTCNQPVWSLDGDSIVCTRGLASSGAQSVLVYSFAKDEVRKVADFGYGAKWLADSRRLLVSDPRGIYLVDTARGDYEMILEATLDPFATFDVSHDNRSIYFSSMALESDIWMIDRR